MSEDRSLDEFGRGDEDAEPVESEPTESEPTESEPVEKPDPTTATSTWTADGADCDRCGERVERRWLDDGDRLCPDCKSW